MRWFHRYGQAVVNILLFVSVADIALHQVALKAVWPRASLHAWYWTSVGALRAPSAAGDPERSWYAIYATRDWLAAADWTGMSFVDWAFTAQTLTMAALILLRRRHVAVDRNIAHQAVALVAFCSGVFFIGRATTSIPAVRAVSAAIVLLASAVTIGALLNLGRSFGILIALRRPRMTGLYGRVRHPMYLGELLLRAGYTVSHLNRLTVALWLASAAAYGYRAVLEERLLQQDESYREYMRRVRFRFVPGLW